MSERYGLPASHNREVLHQMLDEIADRLEANRPDNPFTATSRIAIIQATTMDPRLGRALREQAPDVIGDITRSQYAAQLRKITGGAA